MKNYVVLMCMMITMALSAWGRPPIMATHTLNGAMSIVMIDRDGQVSTMVEAQRGGGTNYSPRWSPDGKSFAFISAGGIFIKDIIGSTIAKVSPGDDILFGYIDWSPNGRTMLAGRFAEIRDIWLVDVKTHGVNLWENDKISSRASWFPDGESIAFVSKGGDANPQIYVADIAKQNVRLLTKGSLNISPACSPDGESISFVSDRGGGAELYIMNTDGSAVRQLTFDKGVVSNPRWSPDGEVIVFTQATRVTVGTDLYTINRDGSRKQKITESTQSSLFDEADFYPFESLPVAPVARMATTWGQLKRIQRE